MDKARLKRKLQIVIPEHRQEASKATKILGTFSSHVRKVTIVQREKRWSALMFSDEELPENTLNNTSS